MLQHGRSKKSETLKRLRNKCIEFCWRNEKEPFSIWCSDHDFIFNLEFLHWNSRQLFQNESHLMIAVAWNLSRLSNAAVLLFPSLQCRNFLLLIFVLWTAYLCARVIVLYYSTYNRRRKFESFRVSSRILFKGKILWPLFVEISRVNHNASCFLYFYLFSLWFVDIRFKNLIRPWDLKIVESDSFWWKNIKCRFRLTLNTVKEIRVYCI